jgi:hypothetical protein
MSNTSPNRRKFFDCLPGTDGCDETFEIISRTTGGRIAWAGYWEHRSQCRRVAKALTAALNAAFASRRIQWDIPELARELGAIAIVWSIEDVQFIRQDLADEQSWKVLKECERLYDKGQAITCELIKSVADELFPRSNEGERP